MVNEYLNAKHYGLPEEVKFCKRCVMSNQRPRITFDEEGVCSACRFAERKNKEIDWEKREQELREICDQYRSKDGSWDVVVPCSGGKDSAYVAHMLKHKYGMHPLTVTWAPHKYTEIGWENLQRMIHSGFDNIIGTPKGDVHKKMTMLAFKHMGEPFQPFVYGQRTFPVRIATKFNIPLIMYGENGEVEYGGDDKNADKPGYNLTSDYLKHYCSGIKPEFWTKFGIFEKDLQYYSFPPIEEIERIGVRCVHFSYYKKWIPQENYYYTSKHTGFQANSERSEGTYSKYASLDDQLDGLHYYLMFIKFGIGRATSDAAHEIRDGHITREEGVELVKKFDGEFPKKYLQVFLDYTGLTLEEVHKVIDQFRFPHIWKMKNGEWKLRHAVYHPNHIENASKSYK